MNRGKKLVSTKRSSAREGRIRARVHELRHSANVIVVPMRSNNQSDSGRRVDADREQIIQGLWLAGISDAGIHDDPPALTNVYDDTFAVARSQKRNFDLIRARGNCRLTDSRHSPKAAWIRAAQALPACSSLRLIAGRSRNTIKDVRSFCPNAERLNPMTQRKMLPT